MGRTTTGTVGLAMAVLMVVAAIPAIASSNATGHIDVGDCSATGYHQYTASSNDRFRFGTYEYSGDCTTVKVQARYWTDSPPYGWVTTSTFTATSSVVRTVYDAPAHDWSKHTVCDPSCQAFSLS